MGKLRSESNIHTYRCSLHFRLVFQKFKSRSNSRNQPIWKNPWRNWIIWNPKCSGENKEMSRSWNSVQCASLVTFETGASIHQLAGNGIINKNDLVLFLFMIHERSSIAMAGSVLLEVTTYFILEEHKTRKPQQPRRKARGDLLGIWTNTYSSRQTTQMEPKTRIFQHPSWM